MILKRVDFQEEKIINLIYESYKFSKTQSWPLFQFNRTTKLSKMMSAYCERAGKNAKDVRFMFGKLDFLDLFNLDFHNWLTMSIRNVQMVQELLEHRQLLK